MVELPLWTDGPGGEGSWERKLRPTQEELRGPPPPKENEPRLTRKKSPTCPRLCQKIKGRGRREIWLSLSREMEGPGREWPGREEAVADTRGAEETFAVEGE